MTDKPEVIKITPTENDLLAEKSTVQLKCYHDGCTYVATSSAALRSHKSKEHAQVFLKFIHVYHHF